MNIINTLAQFIKTRKGVDSKDTPDGFCPNCWGRQEYGGDFFEAVKNYKTDVNKKNPDVGWIKDYADKYLSGIALIEEKDDLICQNCKVTYKKK